MLTWTKRHLRTILPAITIVGVIPAYLQAFSIHGPSDAPTILLGDRVIVNKAAYVWKAPYTDFAIAKTGSPRRGDLVVFLVPNRGVGGVKRIMGIPGDSIEIRENQVLVNGQRLALKPLPRTDFEWVPKTHGMGTVVESEAGHWITYTPGKSPWRSHERVQLTAGQYFLLGDQRDNSNDSRIFGPLPESLILGKVIAILPTGPRRMR